MERIQIDGRGFVPITSIVAVCLRTVAALGFGLGIALVLMVPWLVKTSVWKVEKNTIEMQRYQMLVRNMMEEAAQSEAKLMIAEQRCPIAVRMKGVPKNIGGE